MPQCAAQKLSAEDKSAPVFEIKKPRPHPPIPRPATDTELCIANACGPLPNPAPTGAPATDNNERVLSTRSLSTTKNNAGRRRFMVQSRMRQDLPLDPSTSSGQTEGDAGPRSAIEGAKTSISSRAHEPRAC